RGRTAAGGRLPARRHGMGRTLRPALAIAPAGGESCRFMPERGSTMRHWTLRAAGLLLLLACTLPALARDGLTLEQLATVRTVTQAALSPDGSRVAHVLSVPRTIGVDDDGAAWAELHVVSGAGDSRGFVTGKVNVAAPAWAPDRRSILYLARREGDRTRGLYRIPVDGGESALVASLGSDIRAFSLSPDGRRAALLALEPESEALKALKKR